MTDEFDRLFAIKAPKPSAEARARALSAAMQAFDEEKIAAATQGTADGARQSSILNRIWSPIMNRKYLAGSALATLLVIPAAAFLTFEVTRNGLPLEQPKIEESARTPDDEARSRTAQETASAEKKDQDTAGKMLAKPSAAPVEELAETDALAAAGEVQAEAEAAPLGGAVSRRMTLSVTQPYASPPILPGDQVMPQEENRDRFSSEDTNPVKSVATAPVSTFSADVDTASYSFVRKALMAGTLPDKDSVRVEEMINYFPYDWPGPESAADPFKATVTVLPTPWNAHTRLMHVGIKGFDIVPDTAPAANLVFLIDVSGSMNEPDKLPLLKGAFRLLVEKLKAEDTVSIVTYAGNAGTVLEPTKIKDKAKILSAIDTLQPGGSTAGAAGIEEAYGLAQKAFVKDGVNRVMLATDGDFNVGPSSDDALKTMIEEKRKSGIFLSVLGFGRGNYNDALMQTLAQNGNGTAAYIDTLAEAQKSLVEEAGSSLFPIAKDVKFQVEFNPAQIAEYRLIGYETRALKREDFNNDKVDAGDIGSGHRVTAIYEITPKGSPAVLNDDLRYAEKKAPETAATDGSAASSGELAFLKIRYKKPDSDTSTLITTPVTEANAAGSIDAASRDVRFSVAVAAFGQKLRGTAAVSDYAYDSILDLAAAARGHDPYGYRGEFVNLVRLAKGLSGE